MKRSEALRVITRILRSWEGSKLGRDTSDEILKALEERGVLPPVKHNKILYWYDTKNDKYMIHHPFWDSENE